MTENEFGGYLPLELHVGLPRYGLESPFGGLSVNSGRAAILLALRELGVHRVWLPTYYCPTVSDYLISNGVELLRYDLDSDFLPDDTIIPRNDEAVMFVNYFGLLGSKIEKLSKRYSKVVIDNCMAFFENPVMRVGCLNVYSCRKFFGVADGAYVVGINLGGIEALPRDISSCHSAHLLQSFECGTNSAYRINLDNESRLGCDPRRMSKLTEAIMSGADYERVRAIRRRNYLKLDTLLRGSQQLTLGLEKDAVPYFYPLLTPYDLHEALVSRCVYVPKIWKELITESSDGSECWESSISRRLCCLPVDQRYGEDDMETLADIVFSVIEEVR